MAPTRNSGRSSSGKTPRVVTSIQASSYGVVQPQSATSGTSDGAARAAATAATAASQSSRRRPGSATSNPEAVSPAHSTA